MTQAEANQIKELVDSLVSTDGLRGIIGGQIFTASGEDVTPVEETTRVLPEGQRAVRTKSSGDRVYLLDDNKKTRQWVTNPDVLAGLGFEGSDVVEVDDSELLKYNMGPAIYKVD